MEKNKDIKKEYKVVADLLNVRPGPGLDQDPLFTLKKDTIVKINRERNGFGKLEGESGWVMMAFVSPIVVEE